MTLNIFFRIASLLVSITTCGSGFSQETLKQFDLKSYYVSFEIQRNTDSNDKVWVNKEIGYFSTKICRGVETENNWINEFNTSDKSEFIKFSVKDSLPNGEWDFGRYKGNFNNGKQDGEWVLFEVESSTKFINAIYQGQQNDTLETHEFYKSGIADGQWYTIKNGVRYNTYNFKNAKLDGEITLNIGQNDCMDKANYKDGFPHGDFIHYTDKMMYDKTMFVKGSFNMGNPNGFWNFSMSKFSNLKIEFLDTIQIVRYTDFDHNKKKIIEYSTLENFSVSFKKWFKSPLIINSTNQKITEFYENGKIMRIWHSGTDEYRKGKKDQEFHPNGKIKIEGVLGEYRKEYDINGKLIKTSDNYKSL